MKVKRRPKLFWTGAMLFELWLLKQAGVNRGKTVEALRGKHGEAITAGTVSHAVNRYFRGGAGEAARQGTLDVARV